MKVTKLLLDHFMVHVRTHLDFPESGVIVVTGTNGSGKSSIPEGVSYAGWGKTLRGTPPRVDGQETIARLETTLLEITRTYRKKGSLEWSLWVDDDPPEWETPTIAQAELDSYVGDFAAWQQAHVFTEDSPITSFAGATDAARKLLLEKILGLERYAAAYKDARATLKELSSQLALSSTRCDLLEERLSGLEARQNDARATLDENVGSDPPVGDMAALEAQISEAYEQQRSLQEAFGQVQAELGQATAWLDAIEAKEEALAGGDCPTCGATVSKKKLARIAEEVRGARVAAEAAERIASMVHGGHDGEMAEITSTIRELQSRRSRLVAETAAARAARTTANRASALLAQLEDEADELLDELAREADELDDLSHAVEVQSAAVAVLGPKGYRTQLLAKALGGIQHSVNVVLDHLTAGAIRVQLRPYTPKGKGTSDAISLTIQGAGGGYGYRAASKGERRRIDIAFILALTGLSGSDGTLFFDEVFDGLDDVGVDRLVALLEELGEDRQVVVITHQPLFAKKLTATVRWHLDAGRVHYL